MNLPIKRLHPDGQIPARGSAHAAGLDLYSDSTALLCPRDWELIGTGICIAIPEGHVGLIWPRSGLAVKHGIDVLAGVIDADYRGEIKVVLINHGYDDIKILPGMRIAQLLIQPVAMLTPVEVDELPSTERGAGGFGSTGK
jgi:dUTP pyrophosphatase